jgi:hypothetical protein
MEAGWKWKRYGTGIMFFLLRVAFWLVVVLALLPSGGAQQSAQAKVGATDAMIAAGAAVSDMTNFCDRQPEACAVGAKTAVVIGQRAQAGARMVYEFINEHALRDSEKNASRGGETGSVGRSKSIPAGPKLTAAVRTVPASPDSQSTLKPSDLDPAWRGTIPGNAHDVPLPHRAPHHKA